MPAAPTGRRTPRRRGPAGIATTLRDAPLPRCNALTRLISDTRGGAPCLMREWIVLGVVEGLNPWKDEDHARTREVPR